MSALTDASGLTLTVPLDPRRTYLLTDGGDLPPAIIDLAANGIFSGHSLKLTTKGQFYFNGCPGSITNAFGIGVFSSSNTLLGSHLLNRVPGAIDAGTDVVTAKAFFSQTPTDIPQDFGIPQTVGVVIVVPMGATYLFLGVHDSYYGDNCSIPPLTPVSITIEAVNNPPVAIAKDVTVSADENCQASASVDNGSFDPDGDPITLSQSPSGPYSLGTTPVTLTVEDNKGASDTAAAVVTVIDDSPPMITAPPDIMVIANTAGGYSGSIGTATASDNCDSSPTISNNAPSVFPLGMTTVTWTATDDSHNSASADQVVTVKPLPVQIDIKPGSDPNCFNSDGHGSIPVAIPGSATLDVNNVDPASVMLDGLGVK
ncbi:MAG: HYR domain-containing protein, partial [Nitrososphaerales archaeon]